MDWPTQFTSSPFKCTLRTTQFTGAFWNKGPHHKIWQQLMVSPAQRISVLGKTPSFAAAPSPQRAPCRSCTFLVPGVLGGREPALVQASVWPKAFTTGIENKGDSPPACKKKTQTDHMLRAGKQSILLIQHWNSYLTLARSVARDVK